MYVSVPIEHNKQLTFLPSVVSLRVWHCFKTDYFLKGKNILIGTISVRLQLNNLDEFPLTKQKRRSWTKQKYCYERWNASVQKESWCDSDTNTYQLVWGISNAGKSILYVVFVVESYKKKSLHLEKSIDYAANQPTDIPSVIHKCSPYIIPHWLKFLIK